jgi:hypothetical protein
MMTMAQLLAPLHEQRTNEVVITTMSAARPWGRISAHALDFASVASRSASRSPAPGAK